MANQTENYGLTKPLESEFYDVQVQNDNMDKIDAALKENADAAETLGTGKADLDPQTGKVKDAQLPAATYVEGYLYSGAFYKEAAHTTAITPATGIDYLDLSTNTHYRWSGTAYVVTGTPLTLGIGANNAARGDQGKAAFDHISESVVGEDGVHDLRYYNNKLQVNGQSGWEDANAGGGTGPVVNVNVTTGSVVTATDGTTTLTETAVDGKATFNIPNYGTWEISATKDGQTTGTETLVVDTAKVYTVGLSYFAATLNVTGKAGAVVTATNGTKSFTGTIPSGGTLALAINVAGTYSVSATYDGVSSNTATVNVTTDGATYSTSVSFITLTVTVESGSSVTVAKGSYSYQVTSVGAFTLYLPETGTWTVTATKNGQTATDTINITSYSAYSLTLNYFVYVGLKIQIAGDGTATALTYIDDAAGMSSGYSSWKDHAIFKNIRPCLVKDGVVQYYLNPANLTQKADGSAATINSTTAGDVMVEIPKLGYKMTTDGTYHYIYLTDDPAADGYCYRAHSLDSEGDCDYIYISAYRGYCTGNMMYSISGQTPTGSQTIGTFRTWAANRGTGYQQMSFYPLTLLQCLFLMMYKDRNGQSALGRGFVDGNSAAHATGGTNTLGPCYGETTGKVQMAFLNIEDFWGNMYLFVDGIFSDASRNILTAFNSFNDTGSGYPYSKASGISSDTGDWMKDIQGTNDGGFVFKTGGGSATTYYADYAVLCASRLAYFGGVWSNGDKAGPFQFRVSQSASASDAGYGARLIYKHKKAA